MIYTAVNITTERPTINSISWMKSKQTDSNSKKIFNCYQILKRKKNRQAAHLICTFSDEERKAQHLSWRPLRGKVQWEGKIEPWRTVLQGRDRSSRGDSEGY